MEESSNLDQIGVREINPRAMLDGGGEEWATLGAVIGRLLAELAPGAVLEIVSQQPSTRADIPDWCVSAGHEVFWRIEDLRSTRFWIRKGGT